MARVWPAGPRQGDLALPTPTCCVFQGACDPFPTPCPLRLKGVTGDTSKVLVGSQVVGTSAAILHLSSPGDIHGPGQLWPL